MIKQVQKERCAKPKKFVSLFRRKGTPNLITKLNRFGLF